MYFALPAPHAGSSMDRHNMVMRDESLSGNEPSVDSIVFERRFLLPPMGVPPAQFIEANFGPSAKSHMQFLKGTTTLAFVYKPKTPNDKGGIVVSVDSRATGGNVIASKTVDKILHISDHLVATMAGGAADCQFWIRFLSKYCSLYELREKEKISVAAASKYLNNILMSYKNYGLSIGCMIAGYDKTGPNLYKVDNDGMRIKGDLFSVGSGCLYAYGVLDAHYKPEMTDDEAFELARRAIVCATYRDIASVVRITPEGKTIYPPVDVSEAWYEYCKKDGKEFVFDPPM